MTATVNFSVTTCAFFLSSILLLPQEEKTQTQNIAIRKAISFLNFIKVLL